MTTKAKTTSPRKSTPKSTVKPKAVRKPTTRKAASSASEDQPQTVSKATAASSEIAAGNIIPIVVSEEGSPDAGPEMKKQELIDKVLNKGDIKKKYAKPVVEAVLEVLGEALAEGRELNLPPLGKIKINRVRDVANARIIVTKIRQSKSGGSSGSTADTQEIDEEAKDEVAQSVE